MDHRDRQEQNSEDQTGPKKAPGSGNGIRGGSGFCPPETRSPAGWSALGPRLLPRSVGHFWGRSAHSGPGAGGGLDGVRLVRGLGGRGSALVEGDSLEDVQQAVELGAGLDHDSHHRLRRPLGRGLRPGLGSFAALDHDAKRPRSSGARVVPTLWHCPRGPVVVCHTRGISAEVMPHALQSSDSNPLKNSGQKTRAFLARLRTIGASFRCGKKHTARGLLPQRARKFCALRAAPLRAPVGRVYTVPPHALSSERSFSYG